MIQLPSPSPHDRILELKDEAEKQKVKLTPEVKAYIQSHLDIVQEKFSRGEVVTEEDMKFIEEVKGKISVLRVLSMMEEQIDIALENSIQSRKGDVLPPSRESILRSIERTLTPEQAIVFLDKKEVHEPTLVLVPVTSTERYREALQEASQIMEESLKPSLIDFAQNQLNALAAQAEVEEDKIKKWKFVITEGAQTFDIPKWDNGRETFRQRIDRFNGRYASKNITRLDYPSYIALMNQGLRKGKPIDCKYEGDSKKRGAKSTTQYTLVNETDEERGLVGAGRWSIADRYVSLLEVGLGHRNVNARLRSAVVGDIEI